MKKKMGRPQIVAGASKTKLIGARFSEAECRIVDKKVKESGMIKSEWIRHRLLN